MKAERFDQQFEADLDITAVLDAPKAGRVLQQQRRVNVDFPRWMIDCLDREASKLVLSDSPSLRCGWRSDLRQPPVGANQRRTVELIFDGFAIGATRGPVRESR